MMGQEELKILDFGVKKSENEAILAEFRLFLRDLRPNQGIIAVGLGKNRRSY